MTGRRKTGLVPVLLIIMISLLISGSPCQGQQKSSGQVRLSASRLIYDRENNQVVLSGNVRFYYKNTILSGQRATFNTQTQVGVIKGKVRISQPGTTVTGHQMKVYYKKQKADISGGVKIVTIKDVTSAGSGGGKPLESGLTTMTADLMEYEWVKNQGNARGNVKVIQKDRRAFADRSHFDGGAEIITLSGRVVSSRAPTTGDRKRGGNRPAQGNIYGQGCSYRHFPGGRIK